MSKPRIVAAITLVASVVGCGNSGVEIIDETSEVGSARSAVVNGQTDTGHAAVGLLKLMTGSGYGLCTATLIGSKTVLTAAHCVYGVGSATFTVGGQTYSVTKMQAHPSYSNQILNANDVAVVTLAQAVTSVTPLALDKAAPQSGQSITIVGFGITNSGLSDSGTKRVAQNTISSVKTQYFSYSGAGGGTGNTCQGDSGGPTLRSEGGKEIVVGVHSTATYPCGAGGNDMRVDYFYSWIAGEAGGDLGAPDTTAPSVTIQEPTANATLGPSFAVKATATDAGGSGLASVKLLVDGALRETQTQSPASFSLSGLAAGAHVLKIDAQDKAGNVGSSTVSITVKTSSSAPPSNPPANPAAPGSYGGTCTRSSDCQSNLCIADSYTGNSYCSQLCGGGTSCPSGSDCVSAGAKSVCALGSSSGADAEEGGELLGSCALGGAGPVSALWPFALLALLARRRRRA